MRFKKLLACTLGGLILLLASCRDKKPVPAGRFELRVDAGNEAAYKDRDGKIWEPDRSYRRDATYGFTGWGGGVADRGWEARIEGARDTRIYESEHWGMSGFLAEVPDGLYTVTLHFAETWPGIADEGPRVFDVQIEGLEALKEFDVMKEAGGMNRAVVRQIPHVRVSDGTLDITFKSRHQNPLVNGIEIVSESQPPADR